MWAFSYSLRCHIIWGCLLFFPFGAPLFFMWGGITSHISPFILQACFSTNSSPSKDDTHTIFCPHYPCTFTVHIPRFQALSLGGRFFPFSSLRHYCRVLPNRIHVHPKVLLVSRLNPSFATWLQRFIKISRWNSVRHISPTVWDCATELFKAIGSVGTLNV